MQHKPTRANTRSRLAAEGSGTTAAVKEKEPKSAPKPLLTRYDKPSETRRSPEMENEELPGVIVALAISAKATLAKSMLLVRTNPESVPPPLTTPTRLGL